MRTPRPHTLPHPHPHPHPLATLAPRRSCRRRRGRSSAADRARSSPPPPSPPQRACFLLGRHRPRRRSWRTESFRSDVGGAEAGVVFAAQRGPWVRGRADQKVLEVFRRDFGCVTAVASGLNSGKTRKNAAPGAAGAASAITHFLASTSDSNSGSSSRGPHYGSDLRTQCPNVAHARVARHWKQARLAGLARP